MVLSRAVAPCDVIVCPGMAWHGMAHTSHCTWHVRVACASKSRHFIDSQSSLLWVPAHALQAAKTWAVTFECEEVRLQRCSDSFASANVHSISRMNHSSEALASAERALNCDWTTPNDRRCASRTTKTGSCKPTTSSRRTFASYFRRM